MHTESNRRGLLLYLYTAPSDNVHARSASASRPLLSSQRGDSGSHATVSAESVTGMVHMTARNRQPSAFFDAWCAI